MINTILKLLPGMRMLGRLTIYSILAGIIFGYTWFNPLMFNAWNNQSVVWDHDFVSYPVYWAQPGTPLVFDLPANALQYRVLVTPGLQGYQEDASFDMRFEITDQDGNTAKQFVRRYIVRHDQRENVPLVYNETPVLMPLRFFDKPDGQPAAITESFFIDKLKNASYTRLTVTLSKDFLWPVAIRVNALEQNKASDIPVLWQRMHSDEKQQIMEDHIYPASLVPENERRTALKYHWLPLGPHGTLHEDYVTGQLFNYKNLTDVPPPPSYLAPQYLIAGPDKYAAFFRAPFDDINSLTCTTDENDQQPGWLNIRFQPDGSVEQQLFHLTGDALNAPWSLPANSGHFTLSAAEPCLITLYDSQQQSFIPEANLLRGYITQPNNKLHYSLSNLATNPQPLRIDLRLLHQISSDSTDEQPILNWVLLDKNQSVINTGNIYPIQYPSPWESLVSPKGNESLQQKSSRYLVAPANATELILTASHPTLINLYTRPIELPYTVNSVFTRSISRTINQQPKWFLVKPDNHQTIKTTWSRVFKWHYLPRQQHRTPEPTISEWVSLTPESADGLRKIFTPHQASNYNTADEVLLNPGLFYTQKALEKQPDSANYPFHANWDTDVRTRDNSLTAFPNLVYIGSDDKPEKILIQIDEQPPVERWIYGQSGTLRLPEINKGPRRVTLKTTRNQRQWFSNYPPQKSDEMSRVLTVFPFKKTQHFIIEKVAVTDLVTFKYFPTYPNPHHLIIKLHLNKEITNPTANNGITTSDHTVPTRKFLIDTKKRDPTVVLLNQQEQTILEPFTLKFPLGTDLPKGEYMISIISSVPETGYIQAGYIRRTINDTIKTRSEAIYAL